MVYVGGRLRAALRAMAQLRNFRRELDETKKIRFLARELSELTSELLG
jgi:hypothetical protein